MPTRHHPRCYAELAEKGKSPRDVQHGWPNGCGYGDLIWSNKYAAWIPWPFNCNISDGGGCYVHCSIGVPDDNICEQTIAAFMHQHVHDTSVVKATERILVKVPDMSHDVAVDALEGGPARENPACTECPHPAESHRGSRCIECEPEPIDSSVLDGHRLANALRHGADNAPPTRSPVWAEGFGDGLRFAAAVLDLAADGKMAMENLGELLAALTPNQT